MSERIVVTMSVECEMGTFNRAIEMDMAEREPILMPDQYAVVTEFAISLADRVVEDMKKEAAAEQ